MTPKELHAMPYEDYLWTEHWKNVREVMLRFARYRCQLCNTPETMTNVIHVHHRTYARRGYEDAADLIVLCSDCHNIFHERLALHPSDELEDEFFGNFVL